MRYGITIWGYNKTVFHNLLIKKQNKFMKLLCQKKGKCNLDVDAMYKYIGVLNIDKLFRYYVLIDNYYSDNFKT